MALFLGTWIANYYLLPERALSGVVVSPGMVAESPDMWATFAQLIAVNLVIGMGSIIFWNHFRIGRVPAGYVPLFWAVLYGVLLGTNSFDVSAGGKIAPTLAVVWTRSGVFEVTANLVLAAATVGLVVWQKLSLLARTSKKVRRVRDVPLNRWRLCSRYSHSSCSAPRTGRSQPISSAPSLGRERAVEPAPPFAKV